MKDLTAITYIGKKTGIIANFGKATYDFEWQKSLGIGNRKEEVRPDHARSLSRWKDRRGRKMFRIE